MELDPAYLCRACGAVVTFSRHRIEVQGAFEHRFMNPEGDLFHVGCFSQAIGCRVVGPESWEYPWFAGFSWRYARCGGCGVQLGWAFRDEQGGSFFGLVRDRLQEAPSSVQ